MASTGAVSRQILQKRTGVVIGYLLPEKSNTNKETDPPAKPEGRLSLNGQELDKQVDGGLVKLLARSKQPSKDDCRVFYGLNDTYDAVAVVGIAQDGSKKCHSEDRDLAREHLRTAVAAGSHALSRLGMTSILVDPLSHPDAVAESTALASFKIRDFKKPPTEPEPNVDISLFSATGDEPESFAFKKEKRSQADHRPQKRFTQERRFGPTPHPEVLRFAFKKEKRSQADHRPQKRFTQERRFGPTPHPEVLRTKNLWRDGWVLGSAQNWARKLMEFPCSHMSPEMFRDEALARFSGKPNVTVNAYDEKWARDMKMGSFLSVNAGSCRPPVFLDISFKNAADDVPPIVLVGKGVCFDAGGISIKGAAKMDHMRADMGGAAVVVSTLAGLVDLADPPKANIRVLIPLVENMPDANATKPGDIVTAMDGTHIKVDNTDAEGRLILADALCYANTMTPAPAHVIDVATLTGAMITSLGSAAAGVFARSDDIWQVLKDSAYHTGDRVWRMPLYEHYAEKMKDPLADLNNIMPGGTGGGACCAAGFLSNFVKCDSWAHLDIAGVMMADNDNYIPKGMTGRPTRTLIKAVQRLAAAQNGGK